MTSRSVRGLVSACIISAAAMAALVAPGAASAAFDGPLGMCEGSAITGQGSSAQKLLQQNIWNLQFNTSANPLACSGTLKPKVSYTSTGSGAGLKSWGVETKAGEEINFGEGNAFIGGEIPPNATQENEIKAHGGGTVLTIPVAQPAIAILIHLPTGCTSVEGGPVPGRLALKDSTLEKVFQGTAVEWSKVLNKAVLKGSPECEKTGKKDHITRVVREDGSGTTASFMKYLGVVYKGEVAPGKTWKELGEPTANTTWPNETDEVKRGNGGGGVVTKVEETAGSIGYANVADARIKHQFTPPSHGPNTTQFWAEVENNKESYADPSANGDVEAADNANCTETLYTNGKKKFPPPSTEELWNEVTISKKQIHYKPCYLTYDLAVTHYKEFTKGLTEHATTPTEKEARTVYDYINYELSTGTGGAQEAAEGLDYLGDPTSETESLSVLDIARKGAQKIGF